MLSGSKIALRQEKDAEYMAHKCIVFPAMVRVPNLDSGGEKFLHHRFLDPKLEPFKSLVT